MYQNHYHQVVCFYFLIQLKLVFLASIKYNIHVSFSSNLELNKKPAKVNFFFLQMMQMSRQNNLEVCGGNDKD